MRTAENRPVRILPREGSSSSRRAPEWLVPAFLALAIIAALVASSSGLSEQRAIRALPEPQRLTLLSRTVDELRRSCGEGRPDALRNHCRELALFASQFDECRGECEAVTRLQLAPVPTR